MCSVIQMMIILSKIKKIISLQGNSYQRLSIGLSQDHIEYGMQINHKYLCETSFPATSVNDHWTLAQTIRLIRASL